MLRFVDVDWEVNHDEMSGYVVNGTKIISMNYLGGMVGAPWRNQWRCLSDLEMARHHCGMPPRLKEINHIVIF